MARLLLLPAPSVGQSARLRPYLPWGLLSLRALARQRGDVEVELRYPELDPEAPPPSSSRALAIALADALEPLDDVAALGLSTMCSSFHHSLHLAIALKTRYPELPIWMGGPHASALASELLASFPVVDAVFVGEGEPSFGEALGRLARGQRDLTGVDGVATRAGFSPRPPLEDLDQLPRVSLDPADLEVLRSQRPEAGPALPIEVARGCPGKCSFCSTQRHFGRRVRRKSIGRIIDEMERLAEETALGRFEIIGDNFGASLGELRRFCREKARRAPELLWMCDTRLDRLRSTDLELLWSAGCRGFFVGLESASPETLKRLGKSIDLDRALAVVKEAAARGFEIKASFIAGFPWESQEELVATFDLFCALRKEGVTECQLWLACPLPGTLLAETHQIVFDRFGSRIAMDGLPLDEETRALAASYPRLFAQLGRFETPSLDPVELTATIRTAAQYNRLLLGAK